MHTSVKQVWGLVAIVLLIFLAGCSKGEPPPPAAIEAIFGEDEVELLDYYKMSVTEDEKKVGIQERWCITGRYDREDLDTGELIETDVSFPVILRFTSWQPDVNYAEENNLSNEEMFGDNCDWAK